WLLLLLLLLESNRRVKLLIVVFRSVESGLSFQLAIVDPSECLPHIQLRSGRGR
ncbi:MAG: hypothetical protein ACI9G1_002833, partial [Pirellulaceae bacterium]